MSNRQAVAFHEVLAGQSPGLRAGCIRIDSDGDYEFVSSGRSGAGLITDTDGDHVVTPGVTGDAMVLVTSDEGTVI